MPNRAITSANFSFDANDSMDTSPLANREPAETFLVDARFFSKADMEELDVRPTILKDRFWDDLEVGFPETRYLGLEEIKTR